MSRQGSPDSLGREGRFARAERVLEEFFAHRDSEAPATALAEILARHPDLESELRELWKDCGAVEVALRANHDVAHTATAQELEQELRTLPGFKERYVVLGEIAHGGMGAVLRVEDKKFGRLLAMKVVLGHGEVVRTGRTPPVEPHQLKRFLNEAKITANLDHPGIVPVHELGTNAEGRAFFTMKLVQGRTLREVFRLQAAGDPAWPRAHVLSLFQRLCDAVAYAHERGVIHRDLKPANVMVGDFGEVYVMDWGLARRLDERGAELEAEGSEAVDDGANDLELMRTREGSVLGTPAYMPPEQAAGRIGELRPQSDVYAVGAMLYHLLAGHAPYCGPGESSCESELLRRIGQGAPRPLAGDAPPELVAICECAMARLPAERYPDMRALASDLGAYLEGRVVRAYRTGAWAEARTWVGRNRRFAAASGAALLTLVVGLATSTRLYVRAEENAEQALRNANLAEDNAADARSNAERALASERAAQASAAQAEDERTRAVHNEGVARREQLRAEAETAKAKAIQGFLEGTIARADPTKNTADVRLRDVVLEAAGEIDASFPDQPDIRARLHLLVGDCLVKLGELDHAEQHGRKAIADLSQVGLGESPEAGEAWCLCGVLAQMRASRRPNTPEELERALADLAESARIFRLLPGDRTIEIRRAEASAAYLKQLAAPLIEDVPEHFVQFVATVWKESDLEVVRRRLQENLATIKRLWESGDHQGAKDFLRRDYTAYEGSGIQRRLVAGFLNEMSKTAVKRELFAFAETCLELACDFVMEGGLTTEGAQAQANLATFRSDRGRLSEAAELHALAIEGLRAAYGPADKDVIKVTHMQANVLLALGRFAEAEELLTRACADGRAEPKVKRMDFRHELVLLAQALEGQGKHAGALTALEEADDVRLAANDKPKVTADDLRIHRARLLARTGRPTEAEELLAPLWETLEPAPPSATRSLCAAALSVLMNAEGNQEEARAFDEEARRE